MLTGPNLIVSEDPPTSKQPHSKKLLVDVRKLDSEEKVPDKEMNVIDEHPNEEKHDSNGAV